MRSDDIIDLFQNGNLLIYSFISMKISLSDLVSMCKIPKNSYFQTRPGRLIYYIRKVNGMSL